MTIDITQIAVAIIGVLGTIITAFVIPLIRSRLNESQQAKLQQWIQIAVSAAEQLSKTGVISKNGRKEYVLNFLESHGFTIDLDEIDAMIEAAVYDLPSKLTNTEVKKIAEKKVEVMAETTVDTKVQEAVEAKVQEVVETKVQEVVGSTDDEAAVD